MNDKAPRKRILLAEDDDEIATLLVRTLNLDHDVTLARNGREALELAGKIRPDLLLFDVMMPGMDGFQVSRLVRKLDGLAKVPIVFITAKDSPQDIIDGIRHGARHYITKPFKLANVRQKVAKILKS
ncbi:MAG TPA: response regulator [Polyangiaceae bacterium]|nr:response regulator [Polyangiaceae bacterium]